MSGQRRIVVTEKVEFPLAFASDRSGGDTLVLVLRSGVWSEQTVDDVTDALDAAEIPYVILYLDAEDQALVVRKEAQP